MSSGCPHKRLYDAAQQRRRERLLREKEEQRRREEDLEAANSLILLRAGFGEFGLWGNVPGNVPGTLPLQWQRNYQPLPGARPVSFGPVAGGSNNPQTTTNTTATTNTNTRGNIPIGTISGTTGHGRLASSAPASLKDKLELDDKTSKEYEV
ncbi:hypothetical protein QBC45DRAFT_436954 [Copromyces sp. CBS 386.78]|nr:hypothetical protein QBC45DRAFT_436954 [Copromyces sp. CBS 386.78]